MAASRQPNVLIFMPDGMQAQALLGRECHTPNFDRLARRGVNFTRAHTVLPVCSPARASLMTGRLPHAHGVIYVEHCADSDQAVLRDLPHWAQQLAAAGYQTGYFGKWHIERTHQLENFGWQVYENGLPEEHKKHQLITPGNLVRYDEGPQGYKTVLHYGVTDLAPSQRSMGLFPGMARDFISQAMKKEQPWACCVSFAEPNTPMVAGRESFDKYDVDTIQLPVNVHDNYEDRPGMYRRQQQRYANISEREWREARAIYYALISEIDAQFGLLLDQLEDTDELDNTIVAVLSDHGRYVGAHGFDMHNFGAFEEIYRIPLIISGPGVAEGFSSDALVSIADVCPTLLELCGAAQIGAPDSRSFAPVLADPVGKSHLFDTGYAEYNGGRFIFTQRVLWKGDWKFVFNGFDFDELYNLADDPSEMTNLANDPAYQDQVERMMAGVWQIARDTNDNILVQTHYSPMRFAAVGPEIGTALTKE